MRKRIKNHRQINDLHFTNEIVFSICQKKTDRKTEGERERTIFVCRRLEIEDHPE